MEGWSQAQLVPSNCGRMCTFTNEDIIALKCITTKAMLSRGRTSGRNCCVTPAFLGVPKEGTKSEGPQKRGQNQKWRHHPSLLGVPWGDMNKRQSGASCPCKNGACQLSPFPNPPPPPDFGGSIDPPPPLNCKADMPSDKTHHTEKTCTYRGAAHPSPRAQRDNAYREVNPQLTENVASVPHNEQEGGDYECECDDAVVISAKCQLSIVIVVAPIHLLRRVSWSFENDPGILGHEATDTLLLNAPMSQATGHSQSMFYCIATEPQSTLGGGE